MNFNQIIFLLAASVANAQFNGPAAASNAPVAAENSQYNQYNDNSNYGEGQYVDARKNQYQQMKSYANANGYAASNLPQSMQDNLAARSASIEQFRASVSSQAVAHGYTQGFDAIPVSVRQQFMSSVMIAKSGDIAQMRESASAFMATQTRINTESLAQVMATAPVKPKRKALFQMRKKKAASATQSSSITATPTGLSSGFKNFFKSIQMKIQKSSSVSSSADAPAPTASA